MGAPKILGLSHSPDSVSHSQPPGGHFEFGRKCGVASGEWVPSLLKCCLIFHQRLSSIKGHLPSKVVINQRSSSIKGCLPFQMLPWQLAACKDGSKILPLKFGKNRVKNSRDIPDMGKCCQDKCCLDKCHSDSWFTESGWYSECLCKISAS